MANPKVLVLRAPGTNCDQETAYAFELAGAEPGLVHINQLLENPGQLSDYQILCLPGGFSYGDDIAAGRILASQMESKLANVLHEFHESGKLILGICNGFQVLVKSGFLLPKDDEGLAATLTWNEKGRFLDTWVNLRANNEKCVFLNGVEQLYLPIAHAEGKFVTRNAQVLADLAAGNQLALQYCDSNGNVDGIGYPENPNGSTACIAGICNETGRIFGLMPHPERNIDPTHHPRWTREPKREKGEGMVVFENAVNFFAA